MSPPLELAEFQQAAVDHIVSRLKDRRGSRRFLLADEVGLGKTIVARGVVDALAKGRRLPLRVIYLCSNAEIAEQNRSKLVDDGGTSIGRATELALHHANSETRVELYAFTPGTSLSGRTGMAWERRLMLFLLHLLFGFDVSTRKWRRYFRCGAGEERWLRDTQWRMLSGEFSRRTSRGFQDELTGALKNAWCDVCPLIEAVKLHVDSFNESSAEDRSRRNDLITLVRGVMQRVALRSIQPDLVVLDEVQRFKDVIDEANDERRIASELFRGGAPVLILSATPYRLLTLEHEQREDGSQHHEDFFRTLDFLFDQDRTRPVRVRKNLAAFGKKLRAIDLNATRDGVLLILKRAIETDLRKVICRTERNWYFLDAKSGVAEHGTAGNDLPNGGELRDFFDLHRGLAPYLDGVGLVTDFWKSAPSLLTFMDASYALTKKLREKRVRVPRGLLASADDPTLVPRNLRLRRLVEHALGGPHAAPLLWTRPSYTYHRDEVYGDRSPRKMLVFSGWRFVPKAIAVVVSNVAASRLGGAKKERRQPLRFTEKWSFHVFDTCFPSWALASLINPRTCANSELGEASAQEVLETATLTLRTRLSEVGVTISSIGADPLWRAVARLEATGGHADASRIALRSWEGPEDSTTDATERHRDQFLSWIHDTESSIRISEAELARLALIAVASPATCLLRSLLGVFEVDEVAKATPQLLRLTFGEYRTFFNRPLVQQAVRRHSPRVARKKRRGRKKRGFAERVLAYALDHHLQAVLDEHTYLLRHASGNSTIASTLEHYRSVWSLGRGSRRTNGGIGRGDRVHIGPDLQIWPTHFALAFGEDTSPESGPTGEDDERLRRSEIREAFNSPFWPFVLATTSVGQEGLDFHLHCRDVFHWNLPSNPVDLEQREGRINRRDCLAVRQSIACDWGLKDVAEELNSSRANPWVAIFKLLEADQSAQRYKHGLYPHWIYECRNPAHTVGIQRHVAFFDASRDAQRYGRLKTGLALYRLVFGQANQEYLLSDLENRLENLSPQKREAVQRRLAGYMLNLSPIGAAEALKSSHREAIQLLAASDSRGLERLVADVRVIAVNHAEDLTPVIESINLLVARVENALATGERKSHRVRTAVTALAYLRNPYDEFFDEQSAGGFDDDIKVLRRAAGRTG